MRVISYIVCLFIIILGITFACLNAEPVTINYYLGTDKQPLSLLLVLTFGIGALLGLLVGIVLCLKLKSENYRLSHRFKLAEKELANLRAMSLKENS